jgi:hypothetical protein
MTDGATVEWVVQQGRSTLGRVATRCAPTSLEIVDGDTDGSVDLTLTLTPDDAGSVADGTLRPSVAFMRGRMKTAGDPGVLLRVLPLADTDPHRVALRERLAAIVA